MTLIIGIKCSDGIVVGADSITTFGSQIEQEVDNKIQKLSNDAIIATAGAVGLGQLIKDELLRSWKSVIEHNDVGIARNVISNLMWSRIRPAMQRASEVQQIMEADESIIADVLCNSLITFPIQDSASLLVFDECAQSIEVTFESPFFSIGSGSFQADPFLAFIKRIFWSDRAPEKTSDGVFCVLWALDHVSRVNAGLGVGGRPNVFELKKTNTVWKAERLSEHYLEEQLISIQAAEDKLRELRDRFRPE
ncbi:MAG: hypothetical protein OXE52_15765 [Chloroflexi bacterium]|nr:hypothetical protein [Chloroflexota bacterium]